ncbi:N-acetylneuraminate synthase [uncultured Marivirga sp.]|uniref:N-acetylneuraminate synthase n=1 Tax=uncultured Marivirga sp. TaxID=1123707 RepID=UPI0030EB37F3|tara:strand:+ start:124849 stop:125868 length:1020 start_codon:yes stop_codon:yes gene_type:complete
MNKVVIIAEAGVNHNGDFEKAKELIRVAAEAGADFVKFQTFKANNIVSKEALKAVYQSENMGDEDNKQYAMLKRLEMPEFWYSELIQYSNELGIEFLSTAFDEPSIDFLNDLISLYKIPSGEITNKPYLQHIASKNKPVVLSTGMADIQEINDAVKVLIEAGLDKSKLKVLHCNTEYPTPMSDVNLKAMLHIRKELGVDIGYSDHTLGIEVPIAAVALGATLIEKHFTLDREMPGPDHKASLEPEELKHMIQSIRNIELAMSGTGIKEPSKSETPNKVIARKSIHIRDDADGGLILKKEHLIMKRPGDGISPMQVDDVLGKKLITSLSADSKLKWEYLE